MLRQINTRYREDFECLIKSGLYKKLSSRGHLLPFEETEVTGPVPAQCYKVIKPEWVPFISYPYEWCFSQLRDAALLTLSVQAEALNHGMSLKDASAFNIQFHNGKPVLIDTLSFEIRPDGAPWAAYAQFCRHFLAPLALMSYTDQRLSLLLSNYLDGPPLDLACRLLPRRTYLRFGLLTHLHLHARMQNQSAETRLDLNKARVSSHSLRGLLDSLTSTVQSLRNKNQKTVWSSYELDCHYSENTLKHKEETVRHYLTALRPKTVWDIGANTGRFSRIAAASGASVVSIDADQTAVENNYLACKSAGESKILPLCLNICNPSGGIGWNNEERLSLRDRQKPDVILALAIIHHLVIAENIPLSKIAETFSIFSPTLIIEFVPKTDPKAQPLLTVRKDIFEDYTEESFRKIFERYFTLEQRTALTGSERALYLMKAK